MSVLGLVAVLLIAFVAWTAYREWRDRPPFPASAVHATATVLFTAWSRFEQDARSIGAGNLGVRPAGQPKDRLFVGRLDHGMPANAGDRAFYQVLVVDKRHERIASLGNSIDGPPAYLIDHPERFP